MNTDSKKKSPVGTKKKVKSTTSEIVKSEVRLNQSLLKELQANHVVSIKPSRHNRGYCEIISLNGIAPRIDTFRQNDVKNLATCSDIVMHKIIIKDELFSVYALKSNRDVNLFAVDIIPRSTDITEYESSFVDKLLATPHMDTHMFDTDITSFMRISHVYSQRAPDSEYKIYLMSKDMRSKYSNCILRCTPETYKMFMCAFEVEDEDDEPEED